MKKILLVSLLNFAVITASSAAMPFIPKSLFNKLKKQNSTTVQAQHSTPDEYADFSGEWEGSCDDDPEEKIEMSIQREEGDGSVLVVNNQPLYLDAISSEDHQTFDLTEKSGVHYSWNEDGQKIIGYGVILRKEGSLSQSGMDSGIFNFNLSIKNDKLVENFLVSIFEDGVKIQTMKINCTYTRKS
jgi:hypothetical protein